MKGNARKKSRILAMALLGVSLLMPVATSIVAGAAESSGPATYSMSERVVDTFRSVVCQTTDSHYWEDSYTYRTLTFKTSYELARRDIVSHEVKYSCHYQQNHKAAYTVWKNIYHTW